MTDVTSNDVEKAAEIMIGHLDNRRVSESVAERVKDAAHRSIERDHKDSAFNRAVRSKN